MSLLNLKLNITTFNQNSTLWQFAEVHTKTKINKATTKKGIVKRFWETAHLPLP